MNFSPGDPLNGSPGKVPLRSVIFGLLMSKNYNHLSLEQRYQIEALLKAGMQQNEIATTIGKSCSCISRELRRNKSSTLKYDAQRAHGKTQWRHKMKAKSILFTSSMKNYCREKLTRERWSPELISVEGKKQLGTFISHEWIYRWIWKCKFSVRIEDRSDRQLYNYLAHGKRRKRRGKQRTSRGIIHHRVSVEQRPAIVNKRNRIGDIEVDLMLGKNRQGALLVALDRSTLKTRLKLLRTKKTSVVIRALNTFFDPNQVKTITFDNDQAFSAHKQAADHYNAKTFFTRPYTSQDKGSVENRIGQIRRFIPKETDLRDITTKLVSLIENKLNNRPVRKFNYKTPNQVFLEKIALIT